MARFGILPRTLFGRTALLILAVLVASQVFAVMLVRYQETLLAARQVSEQVLDTLAELEGTMQWLDSEQRQAFLTEYNLPYGLNLLPTTLRAPARTDGLPMLADAILAQLHHDGLSPRDVRLQTIPRSRLWLQLDLAGESYWLTVPLGRVQTGPRQPVWLTALAFALLAMTAAWVFAWRLNRPLRALREAASALRDGRKPAPVPEEGPQELAELAEQFNRMAVAVEQADADRRLMLAGVSHDLRTPLTRLRLALEFLPDDEQRDGMLGDIGDIDRILRQFIAFIGGEPAEAEHPTDLPALLDKLAQRYHGAGIELTVDYDNTLPLVSVKPLALERLLSNLIDNAHRYGAAPITLHLRQVGQELELAVRDQGQGIPEAALPHLLQPFTRGEAARGGDGGSGLGLAIVQRIAASLNGRVAFRRPEAGGFEVVLTLPLR